jgi:hypothetical protein
MTTLTFDTLAYSKKLRDAGIEEKQADAQALALASVLKETSGELATKQDILLLKQEMERLNDRFQGQFNLLKWMIGFNLALSAAGLWALIRVATQS